MSDIAQARKALVARILEGDGNASRALRRAAFDDAGLVEPLRTLIGKVARQATRVTDEDVAAARASGLSEDQIFEIVVCAAVPFGFLRRADAEGRPRGDARTLRVVGWRPRADGRVRLEGERVRVLHESTRRGCREGISR